jgi:hypothetical protein
MANLNKEHAQKEAREIGVAAKEPRKARVVGHAESRKGDAM